MDYVDLAYEASVHIKGCANALPQLEQQLGHERLDLGQPHCTRAIDLCLDDFAGEEHPHTLIALVDVEVSQGLQNGGLQVCELKLARSHGRHVGAIRHILVECASTCGVPSLVETAACDGR